MFGGVRRFNSTKNGLWATKKCSGYQVRLKIGLPYRLADHHPSKIGSKIILFNWFMIYDHPLKMGLSGYHCETGWSSFSHIFPKIKWQQLGGIPHSNWGARCSAQEAVWRSLPRWPPGTGRLAPSWAMTIELIYGIIVHFNMGAKTGVAHFPEKGYKLIYPLVLLTLRSWKPPILTGNSSSKPQDMAGSVVQWVLNFDAYPVELHWKVSDF